MQAPDRTGPLQVVVWRLGDALLAAPVALVDEVTPLDREGRARCRTGPLALTPIPALEPGTPARNAVVVQRGGRRFALPASTVEGVRTVAGDAHEAPAWLGRRARRRVTGILMLEDDRLAALLDFAFLDAD